MLTSKMVRSEGQIMSQMKTKPLVAALLFLGVCIGFGLMMTSDIVVMYPPGPRPASFQISKKTIIKDIQEHTEAERNMTCINHGGNGNTSRKRVNNIAFLKVHKAGSTTMQNLFFRFGLRYNLNILLPKEGNHLFSMSNAIPLEPPSTYNIFACHTKYSKKLFDEFVPSKGSVKIGIVREPVDRLASAAYYCRDVRNVTYLKKIPEVDFIHNLINFPEKYDKSKFSRTHNSMGSDFGFEKTINSTEKKKIKSYLNQLNSDFLLVMLVEKFDESLVMLRRYLSWSIIDIIYLKTNSNKHKSVVLNATEQEKARERDFLDFAIYEYFSKVFEEKLEAMDDDFFEEVDYFRQVLGKVFAFCSQEDLQNDSKLIADQSIWNEEFTLVGGECKLMQTHALAFINLIRDKTLAEG